MKSLILIFSTTILIFSTTILILLIAATLAYANMDWLIANKALAEYEALKKESE
jgi:hypothetical protein